MCCRAQHEEQHIYLVIPSLIIGGIGLRLPDMLLQPAI